MTLRKPLIYIASTGRSGSTILELLLNASDFLWSTGEIYTLPWEIKRNGKCGCGKQIKACEFWTSVIDKDNKILEIGNNISRFREYHFGGKFFRPLYLLNILFQSRFFEKEALCAFCKDNKKLFINIAASGSMSKKDIRYIVDASKDFYRLYWLSRCSEIDLKVIHIVKDPRAYVYSNVKRFKKGHKSRWLQTIRMSAKYMVENSIIDLIVKRLEKENVFFVRYEDLASSPEIVMQNMFQWLNVPYQHHIIHSFRKVKNHAIAGNYTRHLRTEIRLDEEWKTEFEPLLKAITGTITRTKAKKYSYKL